MDETELISDVTSTSGKEQTQGKTVVPTKGDVTSKYISIFGEDDQDLENVKERQTAMIMDGLKAAEPGYEVFMREGYVYANAPDTLYSEGYPCVGIKIHVALNPEDDSYGEKLLKIAELCLKPTSNGRSTTFKVMTHSYHKSTMEWDPDRARKLVTMYPNYLDKSGTNVAETIRLVADLREIMGVDTQSGSDNLGIYNEHRSGNGVYLRAGAFTEEGQSYETVSRSAPFDDQVKGNLSSPETDSDLFLREITEAIDRGLL